MEIPEGVQLVVATDDEPKLHHLLPQFYMERFALNGKVEAVSRNDFSRCFPVKPRNVLAENDYYTVESDAGRDLTVEKMFAEYVEGPAAEALRRLVEQGRPVAAPRTRAAISLLIATQYVRGARIREAVVAFQKETFKKVLTTASVATVRDVLQRQGKEISEEEAAGIVESLRGDEYEIDVEREANLHLSTVLPAALEIVPYLEQRSWQLVEFADSLLLTSDEPVVLVGRDPTTPGDTPGGFAAAREIVFPTDPHHALILLSPDQRVPTGRCRGGPRQAEIINRHVAFNSYRFIIRRPGTNLLEGMVVPRRAPPVFVAGDTVAVQPHASEASRLKFLRRVERGEIRFRRPPDEDSEPEGG
jgi:Protein of unknown function (DUF4238)